MKKKLKKVFIQGVNTSGFVKVQRDVTETPIENISGILEAMQSKWTALTFSINVLTFAEGAKVTFIGSGRQDPYILKKLPGETINTVYLVKPELNGLENASDKITAHISLIVPGWPKKYYDQEKKELDKANSDSKNLG